MTDFEIVILPQSGTRRDGDAKRQIALRVNGEDVDVVSLSLDSDLSRKRQAKTWSLRFKLKKADVEDKLRAAALIAVDENQKRGFDRAKARFNRAMAKGKESPPPPPITLAQARPVFDRWLEDTDPDLLDMTFGTVMAHRLDGDPVWVFIIGPPGDGKTEAIRSLQHHPTIYMLSSLKPAALISGYEVDDGSDPSLLPKLDGKILVVKDFTCVLTMPNEARAEILGTLRDAYDGEASKAFGNGQVRSYRSRFGMLAAVTPAIESYWGVSQQLGERFIRFRLKSTGRVNKVARAMSNTDAETRMRQELSDAACGVLAQNGPPATVPFGIETRLIQLADFVSRARSEVSRGRRGAVEFFPIPEVGTRIGKALKKLAIGIAMARGLDAVGEDVFRIVLRVGMDCIPSIRAKLLSVLWGLRDGVQPTVDIAEVAEVATDTARVWLEDLRLLGIVQRMAPAKNMHVWRLRPGFAETMILAGVDGVVSMGGTDSYPHACLGTDPKGDPNEYGCKSHPPTTTQQAPDPPEPFDDPPVDSAYADAMAVHIKNEMADGWEAGS